MVNELPPACEECASYGGSFRIVKDGAARCRCARGQALTALSVRPVPPERAEAVLTPLEISSAVDSLAAMPWFPHEDGARIMIGDALAAMCRNGAACFDLVRRMLVLYRQWPGIREMRICYCALIGPPLSGQDLHLAVSEFYPDGFGSPVLASAILALPAGHMASMDRVLDDGVRLLAIAKDLNRPKKRPAPEVPTNPNFKPITQADIDREVSALRDQRARVELGE